MSEQVNQVLFLVHATEEVLSVDQGAHLLQQWSNDVSPVLTHLGHHLQLLVGHHAQLIDLLLVLQELEQRSLLLLLSVGWVFAESSGDGVHHHFPASHSQVPLRGRPDEELCSIKEQKLPVTPVLVHQQPPEDRQRLGFAEILDLPAALPWGNEAGPFTTANHLHLHRLHNLRVLRRCGVELQCLPLVIGDELNVSIFYRFTQPFNAQEVPFADLHGEDLFSFAVGLETTLRDGAERNHRNSVEDAFRRWGFRLYSGDVCQLLMVFHIPIQYQDLVGATDLITIDETEWTAVISTQERRTWLRSHH
mmetsp:Transcript_56777/g.101268  ORF Transcript_56777/g.101268 Transcript_56777/m.101268 type:complete len:306 (+) Transcript_56777:1333-2250(+)